MGERETGRQTDTVRQTDRDREISRQTDRQTDRDRDRQREAIFNPLIPTGVSARKGEAFFIGNKQRVVVCRKMAAVSPCQKCLTFVSREE